MSETVQIIAGILGVVLVTCTLLGLAVRFILMPYLQEHLVDPVKHTQHQVTVNHHSSKSPTVLDRIDDVSTQIKALGQMFDGHMAWSEQWVNQIETELAEVKKRKRWFL